MLIIKKPKFNVKLGNLSKRKKRTFLIVAIVGIIGLSLAAWALINAFAIAPEEGYATVKVLDVGDDNEDVSADAKVTGYSVNIADMDTDDLTDLKFDDYKTLFDEMSADQVNFYIDQNHLYKLKITYKGTEKWYNPEPGENVIMIVDKTDDMNIYAEDSETLNRTVEGNTEREYNLRLKCDDDEGLLPSFIYDEDEMNLIWFCFNFSRAAQESFAKIESYHNEKVVNGTKLYIGVTGLVIEEATYELEFGSGKAVTYDCNRIGIFFGFEDDIVASWM